MKTTKILMLLGMTFITLHKAMAAEPIKHSCEKPVIPQAQSSEIIVKSFQKKMAKYKSCIDKFAEEQRAAAQTDKNPGAAQAHLDAAEAAIAEYNDQVQAINAQRPVGAEDE